jgi:phosphoribosyl-dephospho-CoA transferase
MRGSVQTYRVHDLVRIDPNLAARWAGAPQWVASALQRAPWAVVRRAAPQHAIPIGVRGLDRTQRFAAEILMSDVREVRSPEDLVAGRGENLRLDRVFSACLEAAQRRGLRIAPIGAFGFERASGFPATRAGSDLDLLLRAGGAEIDLLRSFDAACAAIAQESGVPIDVEVAFGNDGVALSELVRGGDVVAKTPHGPRIVACRT